MVVATLACGCTSAKYFGQEGAQPNLVPERRRSRTACSTKNADIARGRFIERNWDSPSHVGAEPGGLSHIGWQAGPEFLFSMDGRFSKNVNDHARPLLQVQRALGLRELGPHKIGRHSVASQAATGGHSIKTIQAQLGHRSAQSTHRYAHLGSEAQLRLVQDLGPTSPPHVNVRSTTGGRLDE